MHENCYSQQTKITHSTASDMKKTYYSGFKNRFIQIYFRNVIWYTDVYITCYFSVYIKLKYLIFFRISRWNTFQPTTYVMHHVLVWREKNS